MPIKQKDLAAHWGVSPAYVNKRVKEDGCPLDSLEAADKWRAGHQAGSKRGKGKKRPAAPSSSPAATPEAPKGDNTAPPVPPPAPPPLELAGKEAPTPFETLTSLDSALLASIAVQTGAYRLVCESLDSKGEDQEWLPHRISAFNKATEGRLKTEAGVLDLAEREKRLLPFEEHTAMLSRALLPLFSRLFSLGKRIAMKANPGNPVLAEKEITAAIKDACRDAQSEAFPVKWDDFERGAQVQQPEQ